MTVRAECYKCGHKWDLEMKPMETITCPNCKTVYDALIVVNDPENEEAMRIVREHSEVKKMTKEEPIDYRSVIYAIDHILLAYKSDISPNLKAKLTRWKNNLQKELGK